MSQAQAIPMPDDLKRDLQRVMLPILITGNKGQLAPIGTGFVIGAFGRQALVMSAAHNFDEIRALDRPWQLHHPTSLFHVEEMNVVLQRTRMWTALWDDPNGMAVARIEKVWISNPLDIALASVRLPDEAPPNLAFNLKLPIDTRPPAVGSRIAALGYSGMDAQELGESSTYPFLHTMSQKLEWREGKVLDVFARTGPTGQQWPGFRCDVPFDSGMSGGPVLCFGERGFAVGGVIHADESVDENDMRKGSGRNALAAMLWPSVITPIDGEVAETALPLQSLLDLIRHGYVEDWGAAQEHVEIASATDGQVTGVRWKG